MKIKDALFLAIVFIIMNFLSMYGSNQTINEYISELFTMSPVSIGSWGANILYSYLLYYFIYIYN